MTLHNNKYDLPSTNPFGSYTYDEFITAYPNIKVYSENDLLSFSGILVKIIHIEKNQDSFLVSSFGSIHQAATISSGNETIENAMLDIGKFGDGHEALNHFYP